MTASSIETSVASNALTRLARDSKPVKHVGDFTHTEIFRLKFDNPFTDLRAVFKPQHGKDSVFISSSNYKVEDEINGFYSKQDAREIYKTLINAGFTAF
jgi:hypothetical protein